LLIACLEKRVCSTMDEFLRFSIIAWE
jgi:hypothetical protein